jgi:hypothetical protein
MTVDDDILAALDRIAADAPHPDRVRAGLARRTRVMRQRRLVLAAGGAVVVAGAIGMPALVGLSGRRAPVGGPDVRTSPNLGRPVREAPLLEENRWVTMRYRPTWLPEGLVEHARTVTMSGGRPDHQFRFWVDPSPIPSGWPPRDEPHGPARVTLKLGRPHEVPTDESWSPVRINGVAGRVAPPDPTQAVVWPVAAGLNLSVSTAGMADALTTALRVARSVEADGGAGVESPFAFGWLPAGVIGEERATTRVSDDRTGYEVELAVVNDGHELLRVVSGTGVPPTMPGDNVPLTVRGRPGLGGVTADSTYWVNVDADFGQPIFAVGALAAGVSLPNLVRVVNEMTVNQSPFPGWLGQR